MVNQNRVSRVIPPPEEEDGEEDDEEEDLPIPSWNDKDPYIEGDTHQN